VLAGPCSGVPCLSGPRLTPRPTRHVLLNSPLSGPKSRMRKSEGKHTSASRSRKSSIRFVASVKASVTIHRSQTTISMSFKNHKRVQSNRSKRAVNPATTLSLMSRKVGGPNDPPSLPKSIRTFFRVDYPISAGTISPISITMGNVALLLPGNTAGANWSRLRLEKVSVWDYRGSEITLQFATDMMTFSDTGVPGSRASALHVQPPLLLKSTWVAPTSSVDMFTVTPTSSAGASAPIVHITVEIVR